jgi:hypothetical protein
MATIRPYGGGSTTRGWGLLWSSDWYGQRTTRLKKVAYVSVFVKNQDKALDFYSNVLGFEKGIDNPTPNGPRFLTVGVKGSALPARSLARHTGAGSAGLWPRGTPSR